LATQKTMGIRRPKSFPGLRHCSYLWRSNGEYESLLPVAQATVEDSCHRASAGGARRHRPNTLAARTDRWLELLIYGYTETDLLTY
jgi:hypothetical protein